jgi:hypothetical protein
MTMNATLHRIVIDKTEAVKLDEGWVLRLADENGNHISVFLDRAQDIYDLSKHIVSETVTEIARANNNG